MPLDKQLVDIQLQGLDTKTDAKLAAPGKMLELENARFEKTGRISKRAGSALAVNAPGSVKKLFGFADGVQAIRTTSTGDEFVQWSQQQSDLKVMGTSIAPACPSAYVEKMFTANINLGVNNIFAVDSAMVGNYRVYAYVGIDISNTYGTYVAVYDVASKALVSSYNVVNDSKASYEVKIFPLTATTFVVLTKTYSGTSDLRIHECSVTGTVNLRATLSGIGPVLVASWPWDAAITATGAHIFVAWKSAFVATTMEVRCITVSGWGVASTTFTAASAIQSVGVGSALDARIVWSDATAGLSIRSYTNALAAGINVVVSATSESRTLISVAVDATNNCKIAASTTSVLRYYAVTSAGALTSTATTSGLEVASKILALTIAGSVRYFFLASYGSGLQLSFFLMEGGASVIAIKARMLYGEAFLQANQSGGRPNLHLEPLSAYMFSCAQLFTTNAVGDFNNYVQSVASCVFDYDVTNGWFGAEFAGGGLITGGFLQFFDGSTLLENGFLLWPHLYSATPSTTGGSLADGVYSIIAIYERIDSRGNIHRSAVSPPLSATVSGGGGSGSITVTAQNYTLRPSFGDVQIVVYRTLAGGTTYYRDSQVGNNWLVGASGVSCTASAATLATKAILYTTGGEDDDWQHDSPVAIATDRNRAYIVSGRDRSCVYQSKPYVAGYGLSFFPEIFRSTPAWGGPITAIARQDDRLFAFKKRSVFFASGSGADSTGSADSMGEFERLNQEIGAQRQSSVLVSDVGLFAFGQKGFRLVGRDMQTSYIGADVDTYNTLTVVDSCLIPDKDEARFLMSDGREIVYNTFYRQWSYNPTLYANAIAQKDGVRWFMSDTSFGGNIDGIYYDSAFVDANKSTTGYALRLLTGWIKIGSVQGFMRAYDLLIIGNSRSTHTLQVRIAFDYETAFSETHTVTSANATTAGSAYQFRVPITRQKCESFQVEILDLSPTGESYDIAGLAVLAGIKRGSYKLRAEKVG